MTSACSYANQGIVALHGLQIINNPPLGTHPDAYTHWPPLFPIILSRVFLLAGESEAVGRAFALAISGLLALSLFLLARTCLNDRTAVGSILALLTLPAFSVFARLILGVNLALAFMILALIAFLKATSGERVNQRWAYWGAGAFAIAVMSRWEPLMMAPSLVMVTLIQKDWRRFKIACLYCAAGAGVCVAVLAFYMVAAPWLRSELWEIVLYRTGIRGYGERMTTLNQLPMLLYYTAHPMPGALAWIREFASRAFNGLGPMGLLASSTAVVLALRNRRNREFDKLYLVLGGLLGTWLLWNLVMPNEVYDNGFEIMLAAPGVALCLGIGVEFLTFDLLTTRLAPWGVAAALLIPLALFTQEIAPAPHLTDGVQYSREVATSTEPTSVVFAPFDGMEMVYYSHRHIVRSIDDDRAVEAALERVDAALPGSMVYIALHPALLASFDASLHAFPVVKRSDHLVLLRVTVAGNGAGAAAASALRAARASPNNSLSGGLPKASKL
jgi:hypothetical protein